MDRMAGFGGEDVARNNERAEGVSLFDARPFNGGDLPRFFPARQALDYPVLLTKLNDPEYHIGSGTRGKCVIFNYKVFATKKGVCERTGSDEDVRSLDLVFRELGYEIIIHKDLTKKTTLEELEKLLRSRKLKVRPAGLDGAALPAMQPSVPVAAQATLG